MPQVPALKWGPNRLQQFRDWFRNEIAQCQNDRSALEDTWIRQLTQWRAELPKGEKDFPFPGAANLDYPLTAIHSDPVLSNLYQSLSTPEDYWSIAPKRPDRVQHANPMREFMTAIDRNFLHMRSTIVRPLLDQLVHGTTIYKCHWKYERKFKLAMQNGQAVKRVQIDSRPAIEHVPLQHFYIPAKAWHIDPDMQGGAQWVAQKFYLTEPQLIQKAKSFNGFTPDYDPTVVELIRKFIHERDDTVDEATRAQQEFVPFADQVIELFEVPVRFDADGDDVEEDLLVVFHVPTGMVVRASYTPLMHGKRMFHKDIYLPTFGFYGQGLAEIDEWAQITTSRLLNALLDNVLVVNTAMFAAPFGSSLKPGEPIYPGRVIAYQPGEQPPTRIPIGDINQSLPQTLGFIQQSANQRTAVGELIQGDIASLPSRTPATTTMSMLQEGKQRFGMILNGIRNTHAEMGLRTAQNIAQFYQDETVRWTKFCQDALGVEDASKVIEVLNGGVDELEASLGVSITATSATANKEAHFQKLLGINQWAQQAYGSLVQTAALIQQFPPDSPAYKAAAAAFSGGVNLLMYTLQQADIQNLDDYVGDLPAIATQLVGQGNGQAQGLGAYAGAPALGGFPATGQPLDPTLAAIAGIQ